jgi:hypothetical protein
MKLKECSQCNQMVYLWKSNPKLCKGCATSQSKRPILSPSKQRSPDEPIVSKVKIKSVSDKRLLALRDYRVVRDAYMRDHKICEHPECSSPSTELHHSKGRIGKLLTDPLYFKALCNSCHSWAEKNPTLAKELGLSVDRLSKD